MRFIPVLFISAMHSERSVSVLLLVAIFVSQISFIGTFVPAVTEAAVVTVDATVSTLATEHLFAGSQSVFTTDQIGYKFYVDLDGTCVYSKTTNGGTVWGAAVTVDSKTDCTSISVWYDQWTPGDYGNNIHISTLNLAGATDNLWYNRLDTTSDTLQLGTIPTSTVSSSAQVPTYAAGVNEQSISKGTDGTIYMAASDVSDSFVVKCSTSCNTPAGWSEAGTLFMDLDNDWNILMPLLGGSMLLINRDISLDDIRSRTWNGSSWSGSWNVLDSNAVESATYDVGMSATVDYLSGNIFLAYATDHNDYVTLDHDIRTAKYSSGSWVGTAALFTNTSRGLNGLAISLDSNTGNVYVAYVLRTTPATATTGNVYYATSTSAMSSWGTERGPVNSTAGDIYGIDLNIMSDERIFATWEDPVPDSIVGDTIADIAPVTKVSTRGTPTTPISASSTNVYTGGTFVITESLASRNVTDIIINEAGTIDGSTAIQNIKLRYDLDTSAPYDCASESYAGSEIQFGTTDSNGFSGVNGVSAFNGLVGISPTQAMCVYAVLDILDSALDGDTLKIIIANPPNDVLVSGGVSAAPYAPVGFIASSTITNDKLTQTHFHWRNDDGNETAATSATGGVADTPLSAILVNTPKRLRMQVSNEGSVSAPSLQYRLEYAEAAPTCTAASSWTDINAVNDAWNMSDSAFILNASNTSNILVANGGVVDENTTFLTPNAALLDTTSQTGSLTLSATNFLELEYSIVASTTAIEGTTYCFRVTTSGTPLPVYSIYPSITVSADVTLSAAGTQTSSLVIPSTNVHTGGAFVFRENVSSRNITSITVTETGTVDAQTNLDNIKLRYDLDTTAPYNCVSESYSGAEPQFGATDTDGFSAANGSSTFTGSVGISTIQALCVYTVIDIVNTASNGQVVDIEIAAGGNDIGLSAGSISPTTPIAITGSSTLAGSILTQTGYHWRKDDGSEAAATSASGGIENALITNHSASTSIRLRLAVSNKGAATSSATQYQLQFGPKITTCSAVSVWTSVGASNDDWDMFNSANLTDGNNTTNIATSTGGVTDSNTTFITPNGGVKDTTSTTSAITLSSTQFTELEFSIVSTGISGFNTTYCFRVSDSGITLPQYDQYAEIRTTPRRDFKIQQGDTTVSGAGITLTAGVDYVAPSASTSAFVRITNMHNTGAGKITLGTAQNARDVTAYISNPTNIGASFTISRPVGAINNTRVSWEIIEFIADIGTDNAMIVRDGGTISMASATITATGTSVSVIGDDADVVVVITGINNRDASRNFYYAGQVTAEWNAATNQPVFKRGAGGAILDISFAVIEYTGINWNVQRIQHTYTASGTVEVEAMTPVNSLARTFIFSQKRMAAQTNVNDFGQEIWLSSIGAVSFRLEPGAAIPSNHVSVAWVVENQQTSAGAMKVQRSNGNTTDGAEPVILSVPIFSPIDAVNNASIFATARVAGANVNFPLSHAGMSITSTSSYTLYRSEATAGLLTYRTEIVEWPTNGLALRQNYYRIYADNNALKPTDPWPPGASNIGENTSISIADEPLGEGDHVRVRMSLRVSNANLPAGLYNYKLQYGLRTTSCTSVSTWSDVGSSSSGVIWRGYDAPGITNGVNLSGNPATGGDLVISVSDIAGSYVEQNPSPAHPFAASPGEDLEFDWHLQHNGAIQRSVYCFRMTQNDGTTLDGYFNYPQIRTAGFTPESKKWRWYDDATSTTPIVPLASETVAPIEIKNGNELALRITIGEIKNVQGQDVKFKIQYDESSAFTNPRDVTSTSTCTSTSTWCYSSGGGLDNATITAKVLSDANSCSGGIGTGCGTHNISPLFVIGDLHAPSANREYAYYIKQPAASAGAVYYFRLYDTLNEVPVPVNASSTYPSLVAETATLALTVSGLASGVSTAGIVTNATSTPSAISFGSIPLNTNWHAAHRIAVTTNATEGYRVLSYARQQLLNSYGTAIAPITGTNAVPVSWAVGCSSGASGCAGYHTTDATLALGSTRFSPLDSYAGLSTTTNEIMYSSIPANDIHDIVYKVRVGEAQPAGNYETEIVYLAIPTY